MVFNAPCVTGLRNGGRRPEGTVKVSHQTKTITADTNDAWLVKLDPLKDGGLDMMTVNKVTVCWAEVVGRQAIWLDGFPCGD